MTTTTATPSKILDRIRRVSEVAGDVVVDYGVGIVEGDDDQPWAALSWYPDAKLTDRVNELLESWGVSTFEEAYHITCPGCARLIDTSPYSGTDAYVWPEDGDPLCVDCAADRPESWEHCINDPRYALPSQFDDDALLSAGFECVEPAEYVNDWYGAADDPDTVLARLLTKYGDDAEVVFQITHSRAFSIGWAAWVRVGRDD